MMIIHKDWTWAAAAGAGVLISGLVLGIFALMGLWNSNRFDEFDNGDKNRIFVSSIVYLSFVGAAFIIAFLVYLAHRNDASPTLLGRNLSKMATVNSTLNHGIF